MAKSARLEQIPDLLRKQRPWRRAESLSDCFLYWAPVSAFPMPDRARVWMKQFLSRFSARVQAEFKLRAEVFLNDNALPALMVPFLETSQEFSPMSGLRRIPGERLPDFARNPIDPSHSTPSRPPGWYWFVNKAEVRQREAFFGYGFLATILLPPDPGTAAPKLPISEAMRKRIEALQVFDLQAMMNTTLAMRDGFLKKSIELFGADLKNNLFLRGAQFVMPLLTSADFFRCSPEERAKWFALFDVYVIESQQDHGILIASKHNLDQLMVELVAAMKGDRYVYGEAAR